MYAKTLLYLQPPPPPTIDTLHASVLYVCGV